MNVTIEIIATAGLLLAIVLGLAAIFAKWWGWALDVEADELDEEG